MSENRVISNENLPTIVGVVFVIALLSLGMNFYAIYRVNDLAVGAMGATAVKVIADKKIDRQTDSEIAALGKKVGDLAARVDAVEKSAAAATAGAE